jgi:hypothetical protein
MDAALYPVFSELEHFGISVSDLSDLGDYAPLPAKVVNVLHYWLPRVANTPAQEAIVRSLALSSEPYDGTILAQLFDVTESDNLRWVIGNTMAESSPYGVEEWLARTIQDQKYGKAREMLLVAAARLLETDKALALLVPQLDSLPLHATTAIGEIGGRQEYQMLEERLKRAKGVERKLIERALRKMRKRLR